MPRLDAAASPPPETAEEPEPPRRLAVEIVEEAGGWASLGEPVAFLASLISAAGEHPALRDYLPADACVALADDNAVRRLNKQFRDKDQPTNVLSFPSGEPVGTDGRRALGDIILAYETVVREAHEQVIAPADHVRHLVLHGLLHLMGYDHETDRDADVMEALEIEILAGIGVADPYAEAADAPAGR
jgi:probable rRNA maturation factor